MRGSTAAPTSSAETVGSGRVVDGLADLDARELDVVDGAHGHAVAVDHLPVEHVQLRVDAASVGIAVPLERMPGLGHAGHDPIPEAMRRGIAATAATRMMTRNTTPRALRPRPLTSSPMYCGSFATTRIGK